MKLIKGIFFMLELFILFALCMISIIPMFFIYLIILNLTSNEPVSETRRDYVHDRASELN